MKNTPNNIHSKVIYNRRYIYLVSAVVALGGVLFGFDLVIISGTVQFFSTYFNLNEFQTGFSVGCINLGAALGAIISGKLSDILGRKKLLLFCAFLFVLTGIGTGWADNFSVFIFFRMLSGVAVGTAALVCPLYIAEISPASLRGRLVTFYQLAITLGLLIAYLSNYVLLDTGVNNWRWMFTSQAVPALLFFFGLFFVDESPRWLIRKDKQIEAGRVLARIGGIAYAETETKMIRQSFSREIKERVRDLFRKDILYILFIGIIIAVFSQVDGQNSLFAYAPVIFKQVGMAENSAFLQSVILGVINLIFTIVAITQIDKAGRRKLLLYGAVLLCLDATALALSFVFHLPGLWILIFVLGFIAIYAATLGPVTWVMLSEIFPNRVRGNAMAVATLFLWIANFFATASFPVLKSHFGLPITFGISAVICLVYFIIIWIVVPETKGRSLEEIEKMLTGKSTSYTTQVSK